MADRILIVERDPGDPAVWSCGLADEAGELRLPALRLRHDPQTGSEPVDDHHAGLWPTVVLLVRQAGERDRIVYDLTYRPVEQSTVAPRAPAEDWKRSTRGKAKAPGETLGERAERARQKEGDPALPSP